MKFIALLAFVTVLSSTAYAEQGDAEDQALIQKMSQQVQTPDKAPEAKQQEVKQTKELRTPSDSNSTSKTGQ